MQCAPARLRPLQRSGTEGQAVAEASCVQPAPAASSAVAGTRSNSMPAATQHVITPHDGRQEGVSSRGFVAPTLRVASMASRCSDSCSCLVARLWKAAPSCQASLKPAQQTHVQALPANRARCKASSQHVLLNSCSEACTTQAGAHQHMCYTHLLLTTAATVLILGRARLRGPALTTAMAPRGAALLRRQAAWAAFRTL